MAEMCTIIRIAAKRLLDSGRFTVEQNHWYNWSGILIILIQNKIIIQLEI